MSAGGITIDEFSHRVAGTALVGTFAFGPATSSESLKHPEAGYSIDQPVAGQTADDVAGRHGQQ